MARLPRIVIPGAPHHVTQRGNRRQKVFFEPGDYALYLDLMAEACADHRVEVWSYCLMPNHVHLVMVPATATGLSRAAGEAHRRYSSFINARLRVTGHLFQGRFGCVAMDEAHLLAAIRYVALNPVKARLVERAEQWPWASTAALIAARDDRLVMVAPTLARTGDFRRFLEETTDDGLSAALEQGLSIGRPLMSDDALDALEQRLGFSVKPQRRGRKPKGGA